MPSLNPHCQKCGLHATTSGTVCVAGDGSRKAKIMLVGEAPGAEEERTGKPFQGASGQLLRGELKKNGLTDVYITNIVKCRPPDNRKPTSQEIKACREYLDWEIKHVKPELVVSLGAPSTKALFPGHAAVTQHHGKVITDPKYPFRGFVSYHPAATLHDPSKLPDFERDIGRLARAFQNEDKQDDFRWSIVRRGNLGTFLQEFIAAEEFAFDLETSGLFMHDPKGYINSMQIALPDRTWVIPLMDFDPLFGRRKYTPWRRRKAFRKLVRLLVKIQKLTSKRASGQFAKFDNLWLSRKCGVQFYLDFDTGLASHTLDENSEHDLKSLARKHLDAPDYDLTEREKQGLTHPRKLYEYGARDSAYTLQLTALFREELREEPDLHRLFYKLVMRAARAFGEIELDGWPVDLEKMDNQTLESKAEAIQLEADLNKAAGKKVLWSSPAQVGQVLYGDMGLECTMFTPKGKPSTSEAALYEIRKTHPIVEKLIKFREVTKHLNTYLIGLREFMIEDLLYISHKLHGTVTGRYSSRLHSIPRDGKIRNLVTFQPDEDWDFFQADISQAELRMIADVSGDLEMRRCFLDGIDIHLRTLLFCIEAGYIGGEWVKTVFDTAAKLAGCQTKALSLKDACEICLKAGPDKLVAIDKRWKEGRKRAKAINFGYAYGMYEKKFILTAQEKYGWEPTWDEAHACREGYFQLYSGLPDWHTASKKFAKLDGFVRNKFGRRRRLPQIYSKDKMQRMEAERQAINSPIQGVIGDWKAAVMVEIHETVDRRYLRLIGEHHDAALGAVRKDRKEEILTQVVKIIRSPKVLRDFKIEMDIPMDGEIEVGPWGAGTKFIPKLPPPSIRG